MSCPEATFFHRAGWQNIVSRGVQPRHAISCTPKSDGRIEGVLPLAPRQQLLFGNSLTSLPFAVYGGVAASSPEVADALEQEAQKLAQGLGVSHLELRNIKPRHPDWPAQDLYVTFRKEILPDEEANMLAIPRKQRAMVRKGIKNNLRSEIDPDVERFFAALCRQRAPPRHAGPAQALFQGAA